MFTALRPQPGPVDVSGARDRLASAITGAPDRHRASRRTRLAAAGALAAAAAAATAATLAIGSAPPALATVTAALASTLTQSYHLTEQSTMYYIHNGQATHPYHDTCTTVADPPRQLEASSCSSGPGSREVGGYLYLYFAHPANGRHWGRAPITSPGLQRPAANVITFAAPRQMLSEIKKADKVTVAGPASGPGWTGTRYAFSGSEASGSGRPAQRNTISGTVDVDQQGRARVLALTIRSTSSVNVLVQTQVLTFSDFGAPVAVTPPPADQTFPMP
jgi:hypothetical protein